MTLEELRKSTTIQSAIATFFVFLASPEIMNILPEKWAMGLGALGTLLTVFGMRKAQSKAIVAATAAAGQSVPTPPPAVVCDCGCTCCGE